jgi:hypothetical protein
MAWLVLESLYMPHHFRLHSERMWLAMSRHERHGWNIVKRCESRDEGQPRAGCGAGSCGEGQEGHTTLTVCSRRH